MQIGKTFHHICMPQPWWDCFKTSMYSSSSGLALPNPIQAFVYANEDKTRYGDVLQLTLGVVFLATPHKGSDIADFASVLVTILNTCQAVATVGLRPMVARADLLAYLNSNSDALQDLNRSALYRLEALTIESFYENKVTPPGSFIV